jgi:catechol 2,3-dioxygenase-like lactoylglutathione lyase family enzyme
MIQHPEFTPAPTDEIPGPDLFMTVIKVSDWAASLAWYVETLGLLPVLTDAEHKFALLAAGNGRLAIQEQAAFKAADATGGARLVFLVPDIDGERSRLIGRGAEVGAPIENAIEGYREIRLHDPDGTPLTLFSWTGPAQGRRFGRTPE